MAKGGNDGRNEVNRLLCTFKIFVDILKFFSSRVSLNAELGELTIQHFLTSEDIHTFLTSEEFSARNRFKTAEKQVTCYGVVGALLEWHR